MESVSVLLAVGGELLVHGIAGRGRAEMGEAGAGEVQMRRVGMADRRDQPALVDRRRRGRRSRRALALDRARRRLAAAARRLQRQRSRRFPRRSPAGRRRRSARPPGSCPSPSVDLRNQHFRSSSLPPTARMRAKLARRREPFAAAMPVLIARHAAGLHRAVGARSRLRSRSAQALFLL